MKFVRHFGLIVFTVRDAVNKIKFDHIQQSEINIQKLLWDETSIALWEMKR